MRLRRRRVVRVTVPPLDLEALGIRPAHEVYPCVDGEPHVFNIEEGNERESWLRCRCGGRSKVTPLSRPFFVAPWPDA